MSLFDAACKYIDSPWRHRGRAPDGVDCIGLILLVYADLGLPLPDFPYRRQEPMDISDLIPAMLTAGFFLSDDGEIAVFGLGEGRRAGHYGILCKTSGRLIHACGVNKRVVISGLPLPHLRLLARFDRI